MNSLYKKRVFLQLFKCCKNTRHGAGSGIFSLNLMRDLCLTESLHGSEVCLMDIDEKRLDASYTLCTRLAQELGSCLHTTKTTSREACLTGADYVINTILMGGYQGWHDGWKIAQKWGYRRGGSLHVMHDEAFWTNFYQLRMMESVHRDILRICPDAWYLMVCNPVFAGTTYLQRKYPQVKMVGPLPRHRPDPLYRGENGARF